MKNLNLLFKDKLTIIIAALLMVTLLACIPFVPSSAKYTTTSESTFNFKLSSGKPVLRLGATNYDKGDRMSFKRALGELMVQELGYASVKEALAAVKYIDIVYESAVDNTDVLLASGSDTVAESGVVAVRWDSNEQRITISSEAEIYASHNCQDLFRGSDNVSNDGTINEPYGFANLVSVNLPNLNTSNTTTMAQMFAGCSKLTGFDFRQLELDKVKLMNGFFSGCKTIKTAGLVANNCNVIFDGVNTPALETWDSFFGNCTNLTSVDLSEFDTTKVDNLSSFFSGCSKLTDITFGDNFSTGNVLRYDSMFKGCSSLQYVDLSKIDIKTAAAGGNKVNMSYMFENCTGFQTIDVSPLDTSYVYLMTGLFRGCSNLESITFGTSFTTPEVTQMNEMFYGCSNLQTLDLSTFDTVKTTTMLDMFRDCSGLQSINFGDSFTASAATNVGRMFRGCTSLTALDLSKFDFKKATVYSQMFYDCNNLVVTKPVGGTWKTAFEGTITAGNNVTFV